MRAVIQRVSRAEVGINGIKVSEIGPGIMTLLGIAKGDQEEQLKKLIQKICELRIFEDENGKMNRSLLDVHGSHLIVSQFTIVGDTSGGRRPSFIAAESPDRAKELYERAIALSKETGVRTAAGVFAADMKIYLVNDGPVTFVIDV
jgi:D-tyrosyl-tRNA(Tyr) deacylase